MHTVNHLLFTIESLLGYHTMHNGIQPYYKKCHYEQQDAIIHTQYVI